MHINNCLLLLFAQSTCNYIVKRSVALVRDVNEKKPPDVRFARFCLTDLPFFAHSLLMVL